MGQKPIISQQIRLYFASPFGSLQRRYGGIRRRFVDYVKKVLFRPTPSKLTYSASRRSTNTCHRASIPGHHLYRLKDK